MTTRGIRNNNPGNIRLGTAWDGMTPTQTDGSFCQFVDAEHGIRALAKVLITYQDQHNLHTVRGMINRWAPPVENNTSAYVSFVSERMGVTPDAVVNIHNLATAHAMTVAIIAQENAGYSYPAATVDAGLKLAGVS